MAPRFAASRVITCGRQLGHIEVPASARRCRRDERSGLRAFHFKAPVRQVRDGETADPAAAHLFPGRVYHINGTPAQLVSIVYEQPDAEAAIKKSDQTIQGAANKRDRLLAQRRD
jgi:hypothetical protein